MSCCGRLRLQNFLLLILLIFFVVLFLLFKRPFSNVFRRSEKCLVYSPAFPSEGGPGCSPGCEASEGKTSTRSYGAVFWNKFHSWPSELSENMKLAASILKQFGQPQSLDTEDGRDLHVTFNYYCCYTEEEAVKIGKFLTDYSWKAHEIWFDRIECAIHGYGDAVSLVLIADKKSQLELTRWALKNERDLEITTGVRKHIPHTRLQDFHMTLGTVNQSNFPVQSAVEEINKVIPPGTWHKSPVILNRPICHRCDRLINAKSLGKLA